MPTLDDHAKAALAAIQEKKFDEAEREFRAALSFDSQRPDLIHGLGMTFLHRGAAGEAFPLLAEAVERARTYADPRYDGIRLSFHIGLANAYELMDRPGASRAVLTEAASLWPKALEPKLQLAQILFATGDLDAGLRWYDELADFPELDEDQRLAARAVAGAVRSFRESEYSAAMFLQAHAESYKGYFDDIAAEQAPEGWIAEATRMVRGSDGQPQPALAEGARPYALVRADLVQPETGKVATVYTEQDPCIVALNGLEPLAQVPVVFPWEGQRFAVQVSSRCPWHWLMIAIEFVEPKSEDERMALLDPIIGDWYLAGFNGEFGTANSGRFHFITDLEPVGTRALSFAVDLGRSSFDAITALLKRLDILHDRAPIRQVVFGQARLEE